MPAHRLLSVLTPLLIAGVAAAVLLPFQPSAAPSASVASEVVLTEGLVIGGIAQGGRRAFAADAVQVQIVRGDWRAPNAGDTVRLPDGSSRTWQSLRANAQGIFESRALSGGYLAATVASPTERIALLEARGNTMVYVNGEPRAGDPYDYGYLRLPIKLRRGRNHLLFVCGRGRLRARLLPATGPVSLNTDDPTLPDLLLGEEAPLWGAVVVANTSEAPLTNLRLEARVSTNQETPKVSPRRLETTLPVVPPLTVRKVGFRLAAPHGLSSGTARLTLTLRRSDQPSPQAAAAATADLPLRVRRPNETHRRTFVSDLDGSVQYYAVNPAQNPSPQNALILSLHGASVEAIGQADAYGAKSWVTLIAPTNRRPYGFDWEDWGRLDALEVLRIAQKTFPHDPARVLLTGHSMGGHGAWSLGSLFPDRFAAIGPSAGWISFATYGSSGSAAVPTTTPPTGTEALIRRGANLGDTLLRSENLRMLPVYILHGDADDNVPVEQARMMRARLTELDHPNLQWHEEKGASHWWDVSPEPGADCVDWKPMFALFEQSRIPAPAPAEIAFTTPDPAVSASCYWLRIDQQETMLLPSRAHLAWDAASGTLRGETRNVQRLTIRPALLPGKSVLRRIEIDAGMLTLSRSGTTPIFLVKEAGHWRLTGKATPASAKNPERSGSFKQAFQNRFVLIYGTRGTPEENAWAYARARYDAETFLYRGNGTPEILPDSAYDGQLLRGRNVIVYGNADINAAWNVLLRDSPVQVRRGEVRVGKTVRRGNDLACVFLRPKPGTSHVLVGAVCGTGMPGLRLTDRLPYFISGVVFPDWVVADPTVLTDTARGIVGAGYFGNDWRVEPGQSAWREELPGGTGEKTR